MASTPGDLFVAIEAGEADLVRAVLASAPSRARTRDAEGVSALMRARYRQDPELLAAVREHAGDLDVFEASALDDAGRIRVLLAQEPSLATARSADGFTPLHLAAFFGGIEVANLLLDAGAGPNEAGIGWMKGTPLHSAASARNAEVAVALVNAGADPNARQSGGWTPLHSAAANGDEALVRVFLDAGADPDAVNDDGRTARELAAASRDMGTIAALG